MIMNLVSLFSATTFRERFSNAYSVYTETVINFLCRCIFRGYIESAVLTCDNGGTARKGRRIANPNIYAKDKE